MTPKLGEQLNAWRARVPAWVTDGTRRVKDNKSTDFGFAYGAAAGLFVAFGCTGHPLLLGLGLLALLVGRYLRSLLPPAP